MFSTNLQGAKGGFAPPTSRLPLLDPPLYSGKDNDSYLASVPSEIRYTKMHDITYYLASINT